MAAPEWTEAKRRGRTRAPGSAHSRPGSEKPGHSRVDEKSKAPLKLGKTSGIMAMGAWSARMEIARLLEAGVPAREILASIKSGEEGEDPLASSTGPDRPSRSFSAGVKRPLEGGESTSSSARASSAPRMEVLPRAELGVPGWASSPFATLEFSKKAFRPEEESEEMGPSTPEDWEEIEIEESKEVEVKRMLAGVYLESRKKATPPPPDPKGREEPERDRVIPKSLPKRGNPLDSQKLDDFRKMCTTIFEELVVLDVRMDIVDSIFDGEKIESEKFQALTDPRNPKTGMRYARLMSNHIAEYKSKFEGERKVNIFGVEYVQEKILEMISKGVGFNTPQSLIYALEHFSVIFGFTSYGSKHPRCRRLANDYAKTAPERVGAPYFSVAFLDYLERVTLDENRELAMRLACGKLRLCTQASVRHSDLAGTGMNAVEWCRVVGATEFLGLRAKARITKSGPRPWAASWLAVNPANDRWLFTFMRILLEVHGPTWRQHGFLGCSTDGRGNFRHVPPGIEEDVAIVKRALGEDLEKGLSIPITRDQIATLRWHSCKSTMTSLMTHYGVHARTVRFQGAWKKKSEVMTDLYLREAQTIVMRAQIQVLDQIRRGVTIQVLEGKSLDEIPTEVSWDAANEFAKRGLGPEGAPAEGDAMESMRSAVVCFKDKKGEIQLRHTAALKSEDRMKEFMGETPADEQDIFDLAQEEHLDRADSLDKIVEEMTEDTDGVSISSLESDDSQADPVQKDMEIYNTFVMVTKGSGKVHKPGMAPGAYPAFPKCNSQGQDWSELILDEHWGDYQLCSRCFGKEGGCEKLCEYEVVKGKRYFRCGRRCELAGRHGGIEEDEGKVRKHLCALHAEEEELSV